MEKFENVTYFNHPLIQHKISILRKKETGTNEFRHLVEEIAMLEGFEALNDLPLEEVEIETPIEKCKTPMISSRKLAIVPILRAGAVLGVVGYGIRILGGTNLVTLTLGSVIGGVAILPVTMMISIYLIDTMDYGEWKTGTRVEGMLASVNSFASKLGSGIASGMVGLIMGLAGYDGSLATQSASALTSIQVLFNYVPMVLMVVLLILGIAYKLDKELPQIKADLAKKHEAQ